MNKEKATEALNLLQEECGELIVISSKIKRFGPSSHHPLDPQQLNIDLLIQEMGDVICLITLLQQYLDITPEQITQAHVDKLVKLKKYSTLFDPE